MTACWLAAHTVAVARQRRATLFLISPVVVIVAKRVEWPIGLWIFMVVTGIAAVVPALPRWQSEPYRRFLLPAILWLAWLVFAFDSYRAVHANHAIAAPDTRPIVCIGDSLTSYTQSGGYPEVLAEMVRVPVMNLGQPGITSAEALKKLPDLAAAKPQAVVIELGGHDFLQDASWLKTASRAATKHNLEVLIAAANEANAEVVLIEVPHGFIIDPYAGLERELAREHDLELIPDSVIRRFVLSSPVAPPGAWVGGPYLSDDGLHPNARGNVLLASVVLAALERLYGRTVRSAAIAL
jgi:acyl-CoA thioesterase I